MGGEKVWLSRCGGYAPEELLRPFVDHTRASRSAWGPSRGSIAGLAAMRS